jgi:inorganic pyrophosphatase
MADKGKQNAANGPKGLERLPAWAPGRPGEILAIVETPKGSPNKLAYAPEYGTFLLKKILPAGMVFPYDFGFVPSTRAEDGDPVDVLLLTEAALAPGTVVEARLIGMLHAKQLEGRRWRRNDRLIAIPTASHTHTNVARVRDLPADLRSDLVAFFVAYEEVLGTRFKAGAFAGPQAAARAVRRASIEA